MRIMRMDCFVVPPRNDAKRDKKAMDNIAAELYKLHQLSGADFIAQLKIVTARPEFHPLANEAAIFTVSGESGEDYSNLVNAAQKAVVHGYKSLLRGFCFNG